MQQPLTARGFVCEEERLQNMIGKHGHIDMMYREYVRVLYNRRVGLELKFRQRESISVSNLKMKN